MIFKSSLRKNLFFFLALLGLTIALHYLLLHRIKPQVEFDKISNLVTQQISNSEKLIPANIDFSKHLNDLVNNDKHRVYYPFLDINIRLNGELEYWNQTNRIDSNLISSSLFYQKDVGQNFTTLRHLRILDESKKIRADLIAHAHSQYEFGLSQKKQSAYKLSFNNKIQYYDPLSKKPSRWKMMLCLGLFFLSLLVLLITLYRFLVEKIKVQDSWLYTILSLIGLLVLRLSLNLIPFEDLYQNIILFSSQYKLSFLHEQVMSLTLNTIFFFLGVMLFDKLQYNEINRKKWLQLLLYLIPTSALIVITKLCQDIASKSDILIDANQVLSNDRYGIIEIICILISLIGIFILHNKAASYPSKKKSWQSKLGLYVLANFLTLPLFYYLELNIPLLAFYMVLLAFHLILDIFIESHKKSIPWAIWWMILYSGFLAGILFAFSFQKKIAQRQAIIENVYHIPDERKTQEAISLHQWMQDSSLIRKVTTLPFSNNYDVKFDFKDVRSYIHKAINKKSNHLASSSLDVMIYDGFGNTYFSNDFRRENKIIADIKASEKLKENCFYNPFSESYIFRFNLASEQNSSNKLKVYLVLQETGNYNQKNKDGTNYVVYRDGKMLKYNKVDEHVSQAISFINLPEGKRFIEGQSVLIKQINPTTKIISVEKISNLLKPISLFSIFFLILGVILLILTFLNTGYNFVSDELNLRYSDSISLRAKIQIIVVMLIIVAFLFIGFASFYYFKNILESNQQREFTEDIAKIQKDVYAKSRNALDEEGARIILGNSISEIADVHEVDLNLYNAQGNLSSTVNYNKNDQIDFDIYNAFLNSPSIQILNQFSQKENYKSFIALKGFNAKPFGYLEIKHSDKSKISDRLKDFINTILNLYVFLFLLAGAFAISIANSITRPLSVLADKIGRIKLGGKNETLEWHSRDEIGSLINEYNHLINKLEESASILAKTERDLAWREMAKQVAHEIKNPLTPMKLSIQHLDKAIKADPDNAIAMIERVSGHLIEQIDNLSQIANEFSNFATMPQASNERVVINEVVEVVHDLFRKRADMDIKMIEPINELVVFADKNHLIRILNNLVKNAIQAIPLDREGLIEISLLEEKGKAIIKVKDNGSGIPDSMKNKIFTPNFTTKSSGTGLGLAICANMIESFNGKIYFESVYGRGSSFFVEIPLMRQQLSPKSDKHVTLD